MRNKENLGEATYRMLQESIMSDMYDELPTDYDSKETIDDSFVEGIVDDIMVVTDPDISIDGYEELIQRASEIVADTPEGEVPYSEDYIGKYLQICPACGNTFFTDEIIQPGGTCPVCNDTPEAFVMIGKIDNSKSIAQGVKEEEHEKARKLAAKQAEQQASTETESEAAKIESSEEVKASDAKLEESKLVEDKEYTNAILKKFADLVNEAESAYDNDKLSNKEYEDFLQTAYSVIKDRAEDEQISLEFNKKNLQKSDKEEVMKVVYDTCKKYHENGELDADALPFIFADLDYLGLKYDLSEVKEYFNKLLADMTKNENKKIEKESLEQNEEGGWGEDVIQICEPFFGKVERTMYEIRNCERGSYAHFGDTVMDLAAWMGELSMEAEAIQSELDDMQEQLQESNVRQITPAEKKILDAAKAVNSKYTLENIKVETTPNGNLHIVSDKGEDICTIVALSDNEAEDLRLNGYFLTDLDEASKVKTESVTVSQVTDWHTKLENAEDANEIQKIIDTISDIALSNRMQEAFDISVEDEDDLELMKDFVIAALEDNAEYED